MTKTNNYLCEHGFSICSQNVCSELCPSHPEIWNTVKQLSEAKNESI